MVAPAGLRHAGAVPEQITLRPATAADAGFLTDMLVEAANWSPETARPRDAVLATPEVTHYIDGWPRPGDLGVVAESGGSPVGAAWVRYLSESDPGYGFVAEDIPELSIGVVAEWRGRGVGQALLREVARAAAASGVAAISLSVETANPAVRLYEREGYERVAEDAGAFTMVKRLA